MSSAIFADDGLEAALIVQEAACRRVIEQSHCEVEEHSMVSCQKSCSRVSAEQQLRTHGSCHD